MHFYEDGDSPKEEISLLQQGRRVQSVKVVNYSSANTKSHSLAK